MISATAIPNTLMRIADSLSTWLNAPIQGEQPVREVTTNGSLEETSDIVSDEALMLDIRVEKREDSTARIVADGILDRKSYHKFLTQAERLYLDGIRDVTLDLANVTKVDLSGIYSLHATAKIFRGERYPRYEYGYAGLRHMVEENLQAGPHEHIRLTAISEQAQGTLEQAGVAELFSL